MLTRKPRSAARELVIAGLAIVIAIYTGVDWLGKPLRLVHVLTLVAAGMVAGVGLTRGLLQWRRDRADSRTDGAA